MIQFFLFVLGASLGSFINVLSLRYNPDQSLWSSVYGPSAKKRSHCPHCQKILSWYELIPIVSFIVQTGRCRSCQKKLSWQYPIIEGLTGGVAVAVGYYLGLIGPISLISPIQLLSYLASLILLASLVTIALIDLRTTIIPDELVIIALVLTFLTLLTSLTWPRSVLFQVLGLAIGGGFLSLLWALGRGQWMGLGDAKLGAVLGLWLGFPTILLALAAAFISGTIVSAGLLACRQKTLKDAIPFGPFLVFGAISAFFLQCWWQGWWQILK